MIVLDSSVGAAWVFEDEAKGYANAVLSRLVTEGGVVPSLWPYEIGNAILMAERRKRIQSADRERFLVELMRLPIQVETEISLSTLSALLSLAREYRLTAYDAAYLELAMRQSASLATLDEELRQAAKKTGVELAA